MGTPAQATADWRRGRPLPDAQDNYSVHTGAANVHPLYLARYYPKQSALFFKASAESHQPRLLLPAAVPRRCCDAVLATAPPCLTQNPGASLDGSSGDTPPVGLATLQ